MESSEAENYAKLSRLLVDIGTKVLKKCFDALCPPNLLPIILLDKEIKTGLQNLREEKILNTTQLKTLYPSDKQPVTSENFDISLLYLLYRHWSKPPISTGSWKKSPADSDTSVAADVKRIPTFRNKILHLVKAAVKDVDFEELWGKLEVILLRLGGSQKEIQSLKVCGISEEDEKHYNKILEDWEESEKELKKLVIEIKELILPANAKKTEDVEKVVETYVDNLKDVIEKNTHLTQIGNINKSMKTDVIYTTPELESAAQKDSIGCEDPKSILVSGEANIGKSTFVKKVVRDLFNKKATNMASLPGVSLSEVKFAYLLNFKPLNSHTERLTLMELLNLSPWLDDNTMINETLMKHITRHPNQLLIVLDGLNECENRNNIVGSEFERQFPNDIAKKMPVAALISKLIKKKILKESVTVVTSRLDEASEFDQNIFDRFVNIKCFSESQVIDCAGRYFTSNPVKQEALQIVKKTAHADCISFGRIPFCCLLMCVFIEWQLSNSVHKTLKKFCEHFIPCINNKSDVTAEETIQMLIFMSGLLGLDNNGRSMSELLDFACEQVEEKKKRIVLLKCLHKFGQDKIFTKQQLEENPKNRYWNKLGWIILYGVKHLDLGVVSMLLDASINAHGLYIKGQSFETCFGLKTLLESLAQQDCKINEFYLSECELDNNSAEILKKHLSKTKIRKLSLVDCSISQTEVQNIAEGLPCNLTYLSLEGSKITEDGVIYIVKRLTNKVTTLYLDDIGISDNGVKNIMEHCSSHLIELSLADNEITDVGINNIVKYDYTNLIRLELQCNQITDSGVKTIAEEFRGNLRFLNLACNDGITDKGVQSIVTRFSSSLKSLDLAGTDVSDAFIEGCKNIYPDLTVVND